MTHFDIVNKLIGSIHPYGATHIDDERFKNLKTMCTLMDELLCEIKDVSKYKTRQEYSMREMGEYADKWLNEVKTEITNL